MYSLFLFFFALMKKRKKKFPLKSTETNKSFNILSPRFCLFSLPKESLELFKKKTIPHNKSLCYATGLFLSLTTLTHSRLFIVCLLPFQLCESCIKVANKRGMNKDGGGGRVYLSVNNEWWWPTFWDLLDHIFSMSWHGYMLDKTYAHMKSISTS